LQHAQGFRLRLTVAAAPFSWLQPAPQSRLAAMQEHCAVAHALLQVRASCAARRTPAARAAARAAAAPSASAVRRRRRRLRPRPRRRSTPLHCAARRWGTGGGGTPGGGRTWVPWLM